MQRFAVANATVTTELEAGLKVTVNVAVAVPEFPSATVTSLMLTMGMAATTIWHEPSKV